MRICFTDTGLHIDMMKYQAILFDLDGTLLPMHEQKFVDCFYQALIDYILPTGASPEQVGEVLKGSLASVVANDGSRINRQVFADFYDTYYQSTGIYIDLAQMERFYAADFDAKVQASCGRDPEAAEAVSYIKSMGTQMIVATNPFFPRVATCARIRWAGLDPSDFLEITTYENYHYSMTATA